MLTDTTVQPPRQKIATVSLVLACVLVALVIRLANVSGVYEIDDFNYLRHAAEVAQGRFHLDQVLYWHGMRPVIFVPIGMLFRLFGVSEATALAWPLLASLGTVALVYGIASSLFSRAAGFAAAAVAALLPMLVVESTQVLPGSIMNLVLAFSAFAFVRSEASTSHRGLWMVLSGATFALMPWTGQLGLVFVVFFPIALVFSRRHPLHSYGPLAAGALGVLAVMVSYQWIATGDPIANITLAREILTTEDAASHPLFYLKLLVKPGASHGGLLYLAAIGGLAAVWQRRRHALLVLAWFVCTYLVIEFGSSSLSTYRPLFKQFRYLTVLAVPGAILAGVGIVEIHRIALRSSRSRVSAGVLMIALMALAVIGVHRTLANVRWHGLEQRADMLAIRGVVREYRGRTIYVMHWLWNTRVGYFLGYADGYKPSGYDPYHAVRLDRVDHESLDRYVQALAPAETMSGGLLIVDEHLLEMSLGGERHTGLVGPGEIPPWLMAPPEGWRLIRRVGQIALYEVPETTWPGANEGARESGTRSVP